MITLTGQNPASAKILEISLEISSAGDITCSDDDKKGLKEKQASLKSAVAEITAATALVLAEVLGKRYISNQLSFIYICTELTGVPLSETDLAAFVAPTTKPTGDSATTKPTGGSEPTKPSTGGSPGVTSGGAGATTGGPFFLLHV